MLIVSTPRSASTSFARTLAENLGVNDFQVFGRPESKRTAKDYPQLSAHHSDCREWLEHLDAFASSKDVYKQHIPPTRSNIELIRSEYILLIRKPSDIIKSYRKLGKQFNEVKLREELDMFIWGHIENTPRAVISFDSVVNNTPRALLRAMDAFGYDERVTVDKLARLRCE